MILKEKEDEYEFTQEKGIYIQKLIVDIKNFRMWTKLYLKKQNAKTKEID